MLNSAILEVIIGMIFVYSIMSILVTQINTVITNVLNTRAKHLRYGIEELITDPEVRAKFLAHPLIGMVEMKLDPDRRISAQTSEAVKASKTRPVNWIEPRLFSEVLMDIVAISQERDLYAPLTNAAESVLNGAERARVRAHIRNLQASGAGFAELRDTIERVSDPADKQTLLEAYNRVEASVTQFRTDNGELIAVIKGLRKIENPVFKKSLETILGSARSLQEAQLRLESWFDDRMDRLTDLYQRNIQYLSLVIGLLLSLILNVDSLQLARSLWDDPALRETVAIAARSSLESGQLAQQVQASVPPAPSGATAGAQSADAGFAAEATPEPGLQNLSPQQAQQALDQSIDRTQNTIQNLLDLRLPIGWEFTTPAQATTLKLNGGADPTLTGQSNPCVGTPWETRPEFCDDKRNLWNLLPGNNDVWFGNIMLKLLGLAVTMIAVAQGAPFWFDLLNRIARGRGST